MASRWCLRGSPPTSLPLALARASAHGVASGPRSGRSTVARGRFVQRRVELQPTPPHTPSLVAASPQRCRRCQVRRAKRGYHRPTTPSPRAEPGGRWFAGSRAEPGDPRAGTEETGSRTETRGGARHTGNGREASSTANAGTGGGPDPARR